MKLGGWTRLWILLSAIWFVLVATHTLRELWRVTHTLQVVKSEPLPPGSGPTVIYYPKLRTVRDGLLAWSIPTFAAYALGQGARWVWLGFKSR